MFKSMFKNTWDRLFQTPARCWIVGMCSLAMLVVGIALVGAQLCGPTVPDPVDSDGQTIAAFLTSDLFTQLDSKQREIYFRDLASRYMAMSSSQRRDFEASWRQIRDATAMRRQIELQMGLALARRTSEQYANTPIEQRAAYLDRMLGIIQIMGPRANDVTSWIDGNPFSQLVVNPQNLEKDIHNFSRDVFSGTNATERAMMYQLGSDIIAHARYK